MIKNEAKKCRYCGTWLDKGPPSRWTRTRENKIVLGICSGLAKRFDFDPTLLRLAFVITAITGWGILVYLILWALMPWE